jgi:hypothetical protein
MVIRTFHKQRNIKKILGILIVMLVWIIAVAKISDAIYTEITWLDQNPEFTLWQTMSFAGEIVSENNFPLYTHKITNKRGNIVFLKSSQINLNKYSGKLEVYGEIKDIKKIHLL